MRFIKLKSGLSRDRLLDVIRDADFVNDRVKFDESKGKPVLHIKDNGKLVRMRCELIGGPTKDNGFLEGTYFCGKIAEKDESTIINGIIITAPIYHTLLLFLFAFYIYRCITLGGFNPLPLILMLFSILMFKKEFEKQGTIVKYLKRAIRKTEVKDM